METCAKQTSQKLIVHKYIVKIKPNKNKSNNRKERNMDDHKMLIFGANFIKKKKKTFMRHLLNFSNF